MTKKELVKNAYEQFYEYVENSADENGWVKREEHSGFMRNHFYLDDNIETKIVNKVEYWRPKTLEGIEDNNGWIIIRSEEDLPAEEGNYWIKDFQFEIVLACFNAESERWYYEESRRFPTHYQPITKPNAPLWTEEK